MGGVECGWGGVKIRFFVNNPTFQFHKISVPVGAEGICKGMTEIFCWRLLFRLPIWMTLITEPLVEFRWITPHWKAIFMRLTTFHVIFLPMSAVFHRFQEKYAMWIHSTPFNPIWCFWYTYWPPMFYQYVDLSKSWKNEGPTMLRGSAVQKFEGNIFQ